MSEEEDSPAIESVAQVLLLQLSAEDVDAVSEALWMRPDVMGVEELPASGGDFFHIDPQYEFLEFGSEAALKCAEFLERDEYRGKNKMCLRVYFSPPKNGVNVDVEQLIQNLAETAEIPVDKMLFLSFGDIPTKDYLAAYKERVRGSYIGDHLWVGPPWDVAPKERISFVVEPGLAFGTGEHPTTQMCLQKLFELSKSFGAKKILDLGTGSGILAVAARKFFPQAEIWLCDIDEACREEVEKTFALNEL